MYQCKKNKGTFVMLKGLQSRDTTPEGTCADTCCDAMYVHVINLCIYLILI